MKINWYLIIWLSVNYTVLSHGKVEEKKNKPKNIIFIIADGMGPATVTATRIWAKGSGGVLNLESMPVTGYAKTYSGSDFVTDSAASATALASGVKTYNRSIGLSYSLLDKQKKSRPLQTIVDVMKSKGHSVGIVSTARVTHATPACFFAHVKDRGMEDSIAEQVKDSDLDLLMGGGRRHFLPQKNPKIKDQILFGERKDGRNIIQELQKSHWSVIQNRSELFSFKKKNPKEKLVGLFSAKHMTYERIKRADKNLNEPTFTEMVQFAIEYLSDNEKGFFLMVEAGRIDHASHDSLVRDMLEETLELDNCLGKILANPKLKETLIVLTADHETGGYAASGYGDVMKVKGENFLKSIKLKDGRSFNYSSWATGPGVKGTGHDSAVAFPFVEANHTAVDVPVLASGPGSSSFMGYINNTQLPRKILEQMGYAFDSKVNEENPQSLSH